MKGNGQRGKNFVDKKIDVKIILAALWAAVLFIYVYADIKTFFEPGIIEQIITGEVIGIKLTQGFLLAGALLMSIPSIMIFLSLVLKPGINRVINIVLTILHIALIIALQFLPGEIWAYYVYYQAVEVGFHLLILRYAWKWPVQAA